jgi:hypothetical protein
MYGLGGMWYRAAEYQTEAQCMEFLGRLKPALAERPNKKDDLLTISFGTPEGKNYAIALGFPTPETIALAESLFERPAVTLSGQDLAYARQKVSELRRGAGISDEEAGAQAGERLRSMGLPEPFAQSITGTYTHDLAADRQAHQLAPESTGEIPHIVPGSAVFPVNLKDIPPGVRGQVARARAEAMCRQKQDDRPFFVRYRSYIDDISLDEVFDIHVAIYKELLRITTPYLFTDSAMKLFQAVHAPEKHDFPIPDSPICLELATPLELPYGVVKALCVYNMRGREAIERLQKKYPKMGIENARMQHETLYRVEAINTDMQIVVVETYDIESGQWVYLSQHECPTNKCTPHPGQGYGRDDTIVVEPCKACADRTSFWASC